jgi:hypothetical protein
LLSVLLFPIVTTKNFFLGQQNPIVEQSETVPTDYGGYVSHQALPGEISSTEVGNSVSNFLSQAKENTPTIVESASGNFQTFTEDNAVVGTSTVDLQSIAGETSSSQVETSTDDIKKITEQIASLIENASGYTQDKDPNVVDTIDTDQGMEHIRQDQSEKASEITENIDVAESKILETSCVQPSEALGAQMLSSEDLAVTYNQQQPPVVVCEPADIPSQGSGGTLHPSGYQMIDEKDGGQEEVPAASANSYVQDMLASQISEEFLPRANVENLNEKRDLEQETETESIKNDDSLSKGGPSEEKELPVVTSAPSEAQHSEKEGGLSEKDLKDVISQCENLEETGEEISIEMQEGDQTIDDDHVDKRKASEEKEPPQNNQSQEEVKGEKDDTIVTTKTKEKQTTVKETKATTASKVNPSSSAVISDENISLDLRRSQRRTSSPKKLSPSKTPTKKVKPKVHGTRQQKQKEAGQQGTHKDKPGPQGTQKDKTAQQSVQKDKTGPLGTQRGKTERLGSPKAEVEPEATQGTKRKRVGRPTKPTKHLKQ